MADRILIGRVIIGGTVVAAAAACYAILTVDPEQPAVAAPPPLVAVVGDPGTSAVPAPAPDAPPAAAASPPPAPEMPVAPRPAVPQPVPQAAGGDRLTALHIGYELVGDGGPVTLVYDETGTGLTQQETGVALPWRKEFSWRYGGIPPYVKLQAQGTGAVECRVTVNGHPAITDRAAPGDPAICEGKLAA